MTAIRLSRELAIGAVALIAVAFLGGIGRGALASASGTSAATVSKTAHVSIVDFAFRPRTLAVGKGTRVVFSNIANRAHTATRAGSFDTRRIKPGRSVAVRFEQKGAFRYHCKIHPEMRGKVVVG